MFIQNKDLKKRIIEISYKYKANHISSCLTSVDIITDIFKIKKSSDKFILSPGHPVLALYVVLEKRGIMNAETIFKREQQHPPRGRGIDFLTSSLGHGLSVAVGMALANRERNIYCLISDGEMAEGSIWEALRIAEEQKLSNLKLYCNFNGLAAMGRIDIERLIVRLKNYYNGDTTVYNTDCSYLPILSGVRGHYHILSKDDYRECISLLT